MVVATCLVSREGVITGLLVLHSWNSGGMNALAVGYGLRYQSKVVGVCCVSLR